MVEHAPGTVCPKCFGDPALSRFVAGHAEYGKCGFCGRRRKSAFAARLDLVVEHINECIGRHYDDPVNGLAYESAEGGYQGDTFTSSELLEDEVGIDLPNDDGRLLEAIADGLENEVWCGGYFYGASPEDLLRFGWEGFSETVKHELRYFFRDLDGNLGHDDDVPSPGDILDKLFEYAKDAGLFTTLPAGTRLYRVRSTPPGKRFRDAVQLGPPPRHLAVQTNRMSPPGIVMMYAAEDRRTALAEIAAEPGRYAIGTFETRRDAMILDLSVIEAAPSIFSPIPDTLEYDPRPRLLFLRQVAQDICKPIARDDRAHIEYVPTQVVTEYLRTVEKVGGRQVDGVRYRSSRKAGEKSLVLFATQDNMILPKTLRESLYAPDERWIELVSAKVRSVTQDMVEAWKPDVD